MNGEHYEIRVHANKSEFWFVSEGPKGKIKKIVRFTTKGSSNIYNLSFGNLRKNGTIDDKTITDNKDRDMILTTVKIIIYQFTTFFPDRLVLFGGNTPTKARLYRIIVSNYSEKLKKDFYIRGVLTDGNDLIAVPYQKNMDYFGYLIKRKH